MSAILKFDDPESPHCTFNEYVSMRLAQTCNIPVSDGGLTLSGNGLTFASLEFGSPGMSLPDVIPSRRARVAELYSNETAALVAFDLWIGNWDRGNAIKATLVNPHVYLFGGYDHSHAIFNVEEDPWRSIGRLSDENDLIVNYHPFYGMVYANQLETWLQLIGQVPDEIIHSICRCNQQFRGVTEAMQEALSNALCRRKINIWDIAHNHRERICRN
jgi:hypothetical protein